MSLASFWWRNLLFASPFLAFGMNVSAADVSHSLGSVPGMQLNPRVAFGSSGGYFVWQDSLADHRKFGISARKLDDNFDPQGDAFSVNVITAENQMNPALGILPDGNILFVWEGGKPGAADIFGRVRSDSGKWITRDFFINTFRRGAQIEPVVAVLKDGNAVVAWNSSGQDGSLFGVFGQRLAASGRRLGPEFRLNQYVDLNQRNVSLAAQSDGSFVATWISHGQRSKQPNAREQIVRVDQQKFESVDVYARRFGASGQPLGDEFLVNTGNSVCFSPSVAASDSGFSVVWVERNRAPATGMAVQKRSFDLTGNPATEAETVAAAETLAGVSISGSGDRYLVSWTRPGRKNVIEGFFGKFLDQSGAVSGDEFSLAAQVIGKDLRASSSAKLHGDFFAVWPGYVPGSAFDLFGKSVR